MPSEVESKIDSLKFSSICLKCGDPIVLYTDLVAGPTSGGEGNRGAYLNIFGTNFGASSDMGVSTKVYINNVEVAAYKTLGLAKGQPFARNGLLLQQLGVQVGALGGLAPGARGAIKVVVGGVSSNTDLTFTNQPGDMIYVALNGSDTSGDGSFEKPYRLVQSPGRDNPAWKALGPGDTIVMRGGIWSDVGYDGRFMRLVSQMGGSEPTGAVGTGYIAFQGYPGEDVQVALTYANGAGNYRGGFVGPPSDYHAFSHYIVIAGIAIHDDDATKPTWSGIGPIGTQTSGDHWRIVNNELTVRIGNAVQQKAGAITGALRNAVILGNNLHDIQGLTMEVYNTLSAADKSKYEPLTNHAMYFDNYTSNLEIAYNNVSDVSGGSGIQFFGNLGSVCGYPACALEGLSVHHNTVANVTGKYGLNFAWVVTTGVAYDNVIIHTRLPGLRLGSSDFDGFKIVNNSFYDVSYSGNYAAVFVDGNVYATDKTTLYVENNIVYASTRAPDYYSYYNGSRTNADGTVESSDSGVFMTNNLWYGNDSVIPAKDAGGKYGDPKYFNMTVGAEDLRINATSPAFNTAVSGSYAPAVDALLNLRTGTLDIGAFEVQ